MEQIPFRQFLQTAFEGGAYTTDELIAFVLPLFREVLSLHEEGRVAPFEYEDSIFVTTRQLHMDENRAQPPTQAMARIEALFHKPAPFEIVGTNKLDTDVDAGSQQLEDLQVQTDHSAPIERPVYLPGYSCFEMKLGHHDH